MLGLKNRILKITACSVLLMGAHASYAASPLSLEVDADSQGPEISRHIFGQFVEHLGSNVYGGIWVGPESTIPNVRGIRKDLVDALKEIRVPNVRWPGGCYAEEYHWRNGIGPAEDRPATLNIAWGNVIETNAFGTHEFFDFAEQIGAETFLNINMASGTVQEAVEWVEYVTSGHPTAMAKLREANGRKEPWQVNYLGLGNEVWACGGAMSAEGYIEEMKRYAMFVRNLHPEQMAPNRFVPSKNPMVRIAVGPGEGEGYEHYTEEVMKAWVNKESRWGIEGLSLHKYTMGPRGAMQDPSENFGEADYAAFLESTYEMEDFIEKHIAIMDKYDPDNKLILAVDEWGVWLRPMEGTNMLFLQQQNSLRDAIVGALHLNMFARNADRIKLANVAQLANVLQSMILTDGEEMVLTPTYHIFKMYVPFQDANALPIKLKQGRYKFENIELPQVDGIAAKTKDGQVYVALTNLDPTKEASISFDIDGFKASKAVGEVLTAPAVDSINTFDAPEVVVPKTVSTQSKNGELLIVLPPKSVSVLRLES